MVQLVPQRKKKKKKIKHSIGSSLSHSECFNIYNAANVHRLVIFLCIYHIFIFFTYALFTHLSNGVPRESICFYTVPVDAYCKFS